MLSSVDAVLRFLELVQRELQADDARLEIGVQPAAEPLWLEMPGGFRLVVVGARMPAPLEEQRARLAMLAETFSQTLGAAMQQVPELHVPSTANEALDDTLAALARVAHATAAAVVDERSPVIWGSSVVPRGPEDADVAAWVSSAAMAATRGGLDLAEVLGADAKTRDATLVKLAPDDQARVQRALARLEQLGHLDSAEKRRRFVLTMRAIAAARRGAPDAKMVATEHDPLGWLARGFAGIYRLVLVFDGTYSELHAGAAMIRALPVIERMVVGLPPVDPPKGGQIVRMFPPK